MCADIFHNIEIERRKNGLSVEELCQKIGISRSTYYQWKENGKVPATKIVLLTEIFRVTADYLLGLYKLA